MTAIRTQLGVKHVSGSTHPTLRAMILWPIAPEGLGAVGASLGIEAPTSANIVCELDAERAMMRVEYVNDAGIIAARSLGSTECLVTIEDLHGLLHIDAKDVCHITLGFVQSADGILHAKDLLYARTNIAKLLRLHAASLDRPLLMNLSQESS